MNLYKHEKAQDENVAWCPSEKKPVALDSLSVNDFNVEIEKGYIDMKEGKVRPASAVFADLRRDYKI